MTDQTHDDYPAWICRECGKARRTRPATKDHIVAFHVGDPCGWCGRDDVEVAEPRDYGYPPKPPRPRR